jgi:predicted aspartyl protease
VARLAAGLERRATLPHRSPGAPHATFAIFVALLGAIVANAHAERSRVSPREGRLVLPVENRDGVVLIQSKLFAASGKDTSGSLVLDTGAGFVALDRPLAEWLGISDEPGATDTTARATVGVAARPLARLELGGRQIDAISPVLLVDAEIIRRVTDRPVLGLIGQGLLARQIVQIDYRRETVTLIPAPDRSAAPTGASAIARSRAALRSELRSKARAIPFELAGDGKMVVAARIGATRARLELILDTGATKTVLFRSPADANPRDPKAGKALCGLVAPTFFGESEACVVRIPRLQLVSGSGGVSVSQSDAVELESPLQALLEQVTGRKLGGLLGYSFLKHFRVTIDFPNRIVWFEEEPKNWDGREREYIHVGVQLERRDEEVTVVAVAHHSPASEAGIAPGDALVSLDGAETRELDVLELARRLEGDEGSTVELGIRSAGALKTIRLKRRRLL